MGGAFWRLGSLSAKLRLRVRVRQARGGSSFNDFVKRTQTEKERTLTGLQTELRIALARPRVVRDASESTGLRIIVSKSLERRRRQLSR